MVPLQVVEHEIEHGKKLAGVDTELAWGWGTPAGRLRAERRAQLIIQGGEVRPGIRVLEIGCGTGNFTEIFASTGAQIVAVDISAELIRKAYARQLPEEQVQFLEKRFEDCDVDGPFDAVIGSSILHHLDLHTALGKMYNLLKPTGRISFAEPNILNPQVFLERKLSFIRPLFWYISPDETAFVRWSLRKKLEWAGFTNVCITPFDWLHPAVPSGMINLVSRLGRLFEKIPVIREFSGSLFMTGIKPVDL
jgi:2-polyprenyl-3-methyl-5-hydroxy-6-metoxy-1,4-benzoquinol methylase